MIHFCSVTAHKCSALHRCYLEGAISTASIIIGSGYSRLALAEPRTCDHCLWHGRCGVVRCIGKHSDICQQMKKERTNESTMLTAVPIGLHFASFIMLINGDWALEINLGNPSRHSISCKHSPAFAKAPHDINPCVLVVVNYELYCSN